MNHTQSAPGQEIKFDGTNHVAYLNWYYLKFTSLPTMMGGKDTSEMADELSDLPGLHPDVNYLLKMHK